MTAVVGALFLVLVYLAFGQADVTRNGAQTAADAAAIAAAQESRDQLDLMELLDDLEAIFDGSAPLGTPDGCERAVELASRNNAVAGYEDCSELQDGRWGFTVRVTSEESMGNSIIQGTENQHATATATAVVEPRCTFLPSPSEAPDESQTPEPGEEEPPEPSPGELRCDSEDWVIDPAKPDLLPQMADLFTVRLAED